MTDSLNIMILAAGLGERLRPVTDHIPKPLVPVLGKPVLEYVLDSIASLPFRSIGINVFHKKETIQRWVSNSRLADTITVFPEESILGTGGALKNAEALLKERTFLVHNADILTDLDLLSMLEAHRASGNLATLAVHDFPQYNSLLLDDARCLMAVDRNSEESNKVAFTGVALYEPEFLQFLPEGKSGVVDSWIMALRQGKRIGTHDVSGCSWTDIGTPTAYARAVFEALQRQGETVYIHSSVLNCADADIRGNVVLEEGCSVTGSASLRNCIILPNASPGDDAEVSNCIVSPAGAIGLNEYDIVPVDNEGRTLIGTGGSERKYYRVHKDGRTAVRMVCREDDQDFERHIEYTRFFHELKVPVPGLIAADYEKKEAVFEDAGDRSLYAWLKCSRKKDELIMCYRLVLDALVQVHAISEEQWHACPLLQDRQFDYGHFRWESGYFIDAFVDGIAGNTNVHQNDLRRELDSIAAASAEFPKAVVHRDFQSQNIMVRPYMDIRIIDFQGARIGPPAYDIASLLWDPYHRLEEEVREELLRYYLDKSVQVRGEEWSASIRKSLLLCRLQRHMQALGAYGFLSSQRGKKHFLKFVPEGIRLLRSDIVQLEGAYPALSSLIADLARRIPSGRIPS